MLGSRALGELSMIAAVPSPWGPSAAPSFIPLKVQEMLQADTTEGSLVDYWPLRNARPLLEVSDNQCKSRGSSVAQCNSDEIKNPFSKMSQ